MLFRSVSSLSIEAIKEIYEIRIMLEERCAIYAVQNMNDEDMAEILELIDKMVEAEADPENRGFSTRRAFYSRIYECANRPMMHDQILLLRDNVSRYHRVKNHDPAHDDHLQFRDAIMRRDAEGAATVLKRHLEGARDELLMYMESQYEQEE